MGRAPVSGDERGRTPQQASRRSGGSGFESPPPLTSLTLAADLVESVAAQDEEWRQVPGYTDGYEVSNLGRVRSWRPVGGRGSDRPRGQVSRLLKPVPSTRGRLAVTMTRDGKRATVFIHTAVALAFLGPKPDGQMVRHLNDDYLNNTLPNLAYGTGFDNGADAVRNGRNGRNWHLAQTTCPKGHAYSAERRTQDGRDHRRCRDCEREQRRKSNERRRMSRAELIVQELVAEKITPTRALARLRHAHLTDDREALTEAAAALTLRDRFLGFEGDPVAFTGVAFSADSSVSVWDLAVELCEDSLESNVRVLAGTEMRRAS